MATTRNVHGLKVIGTRILQTVGEKESRSKAGENCEPQHHPARAAGKTKRILPLLKPYPAEKMEAYPVSTVVNNPGHGSNKCVLPLLRTKSQSDQIK